MPHTPIAHDVRMERPTRLYLIPMLTVIVFMRHNIGERVLLLRWIIPTALALYLIQPLSGRSPHDHLLPLFAVAFFVLSVLHLLYAHLTTAMNGGPQWQSYDRGSSWLNFLPLPDALIHMVIDPALCGYAGWWTATHLSPWLGFWLMIAAAALFLTEMNDRRHEHHRIRDLYDGEIESRNDADTIRARRSRSGFRWLQR